MPEDFSKGLEGVLAAESKVCFIDGEEGKLLYRGYNIHDLAEKSSFEEVAYLLLYGQLPTESDLKKFNKKLAIQRQLPKDLLKAMRIYAKTASPMDALRTSISMLADDDKKLKDLSPARNLARAISLTAKMPTLVTAAYRIKKRRTVIKPNPKMGQAANFLYMLTGKKPDEVAIKALDTDFILHAEHGFNASTFSARVTISTLSDLYAAITAAIGTLKGPLHGGAAGEVFQMLKAIKTVDKAESYVQNAIANKQKIMGLGHRVYKTHDPRAIHLKNMAKMLADDKRNYKYFAICDRVEEVAVPLLSQKHIYPNVDFYSSTVYNALGIPEDLFDTLFATSRITGWCAHVLEQLADNRIIRPREKYVGAVDLAYVPITERAKTPEKTAEVVQMVSPIDAGREQVVHVKRVKKAEEPEPEQAKEEPAKEEQHAKKKPKKEQEEKKEPAKEEPKEEPAPAEEPANEQQEEEQKEEPAKAEESAEKEEPKEEKKPIEVPAAAAQSMSVEQIINELTEVIAEPFIGNEKEQQVAEQPVAPAEPIVQEPAQETESTQAALSQDPVIETQQAAIAQEPVRVEQIIQEAQPAAVSQEIIQEQSAVQEQAQVAPVVQEQPAPVQEPIQFHIVKETSATVIQEQVQSDPIQEIPAAQDVIAAKETVQAEQPVVMQEQPQILPVQEAPAAAAEPAASQEAQQIEQIVQEVAQPVQEAPIAEAVPIAAETLQANIEQAEQLVQKIVSQAEVAQEFASQSPIPDPTPQIFSEPIVQEAPAAIMQSAPAIQEILSQPVVAQQIAQELISEASIVTASQDALPQVLPVDNAVQEMMSGVASVSETQQALSQIAAASNPAIQEIISQVITEESKEKSDQQ